MMQVFYKLSDAKRYAKKAAKDRGVGFHIFKTLRGSPAWAIHYEFIAMSFDDSLMPESLETLENVLTIKGA